MAEGVDVSRHQGTIDWAAAKRGGIEFVYVKLTEGVGYLDPSASKHVNAARSAGLTVGGYHFARPDTNSPEAEALTFADALRARDLAKPGALPPCLDMEKPAPGNLINWSQRFLAALRRITNHQPAMVYASSSWWTDRYGGGAWLDASTWAWVAHYGRAAGAPGFKTGKVVMHQYTESGRISGYSGNIDRNTCWVDLAKLTGGTAAPAPAPAPTPAPSASGTHTVQPGETLSGIAAKLGTTWQALYEANRDVISDPDTIQAGWVLRVGGAAPSPPPSAPAQRYTVQSGDTLSGIAAKLGTTWQALYEANRDVISDPDTIQAGWVLRVGGGTSNPPQAEWYTILPGDTLSGIAAKKNVSGGWQALYAANRNIIVSPDRVQAGWRIRIPR